MIKKLPLSPADPRISLLSAALLALGCSSTEPIQPGTGRAIPDIRAKVTGMDQVTLGLRLEVVGDARKLDALATWFFEAMAQSPWLDIESRQEPVLDQRIVLRGKLPEEGGPKTVLTTSLQRKGMGPVPLAAVELAPRTRLAVALDALAEGTRLGLGEPRSSVASQAASVEAIVSPLVAVAATCTRARRRANRHDRGIAIANLEKALQKDPASAYVQCMLSSLLLDQGKAKNALTYAEKVGMTPARATPRLVHDAKRDILLATARYEDMIQLADLTLAVRPRDPYVKFTKALAQCMLRDYPKALPVLEKLSKRLPLGRGVNFALAYALLGTGKPDACMQLLPHLEKLLDKRLTTRIRCLCLYELGKLDELQDFLRTLAHDPEFRGNPGAIEVIGIKACFALLRRQDEDAARILLEQLDELRAWPAILDANPQILLDAAWTLVRLDDAARCAAALNAIPDINHRSERAQRTIILAREMCRLALSKDGIAEESLRPIAIMGYREAERRLEAQNLIKKGHPDQALDIQRRVGLTSKDPSLVVETAESLQALGRLDDARKMLRETARFVSIPRMDKPGNHPLLRAKYAYIVTMSERM